MAEETSKNTKTEKAPSKTAQIKELKETLKALTSEKENTKDKVKARQLRRGIRRANKKLAVLQGKTESDVD